MSGNILRNVQMFLKNSFSQQSYDILQIKKKTNTKINYITPYLAEGDEPDK